jgi:hypothetical protein
MKKLLLFMFLSLVAINIQSKIYVYLPDGSSDVRFYHAKTQSIHAKKIITKPKKKHGYYPISEKRGYNFLLIYIKNNKQKYYNITSNMSSDNMSSDSGTYVSLPIDTWTKY